MKKDFYINRITEIGKSNIDDKAAWWKSQGIVSCALHDIEIQGDDYIKILECRDSIFSGEKTPPMSL